MQNKKERVLRTRAVRVKTKEERLCVLKNKERVLHSRPVRVKKKKECSTAGPCVLKKRECSTAGPCVLKKKECSPRWDRGQGRGGGGAGLHDISGLFLPRLVCFHRTHVWRAGRVRLFKFDDVTKTCNQDLHPLLCIPDRRSCAPRTGTRLGLCHRPCRGGAKRFFCTKTRKEAVPLELLQQTHSWCTTREN